MSFVKRCLSAVKAFRPTFSPFLRFVDQREPDRPRHLSRFVFAPFITFISQTVSQLARHDQYIDELTGVLGSVATQLAAMSTQQRLIAAPPLPKMLTANGPSGIEIGEINVHPFAALHHPGGSQASRGCTGV
ncbi:hypothetical protein Rhopal_007274-T1 [Rhodotorula paludigena]|uniref:Uncharacterized protein n=1 Tax=Rhodotorula paludigena TaxID=86838 RepID=A0AAV5GXK7_9BASI|nr:hypothetical protein Rhopal_007274-T1 [Rhodotorula paludigena]